MLADSGNNTIRYVSFDGAVTNIAGLAGSFGLVNSADPTLARFRFPTGLATDSTGNICVADSLNHAIRMISPANAVTTLATGFFQPNAIAVDQDSNLWVADTRNHQVKLINSGSGALLATVGDGSAGAIDSLVAAAAQFNQPRGLTFLSSSGGVLVSRQQYHTPHLHQLGHLGLLSPDRGRGCRPCRQR